MASSRPKIYIVVEGERYEGFTVIGNHLDRRQAITFAEKLANKIAQTNEEELEQLNEMQWRIGSDMYVGINEYDINDLNEDKINNRY